MHFICHATDGEHTFRAHISLRERRVLCEVNGQKGGSLPLLVHRSGDLDLPFNSELFPNVGVSEDRIDRFCEALQEAVTNVVDASRSSQKNRYFIEQQGGLIEMSFLRWLLWQDRYASPLLERTELDDYTVLTLFTGMVPKEQNPPKPYLTSVVRKGQVLNTEYSDTREPAQLAHAIRVSEIHRAIGRLH